MKYILVVLALVLTGCDGYTMAPPVPVAHIAEAESRCANNGGLYSIQVNNVAYGYSIVYNVVCKNSAKFTLTLEFRIDLSQQPQWTKPQ